MQQCRWVLPRRLYIKFTLTAAMRAATFQALSRCSLESSPPHFAALREQTGISRFVPFRYALKLAEPTALSRFEPSLRVIVAVEERVLRKSGYATAIFVIISAGSPALPAKIAKPKLHPRPVNRPAPALAPALPAIALISSLLVAGTAIRRKGLTKVSS